MEKTAESPIIADTSALVSLATDIDHNHIPAKEAAARLHEVSRAIILPAAVFVETINVLGKRSGHETALKTATELLRPEGQFVLIETIPFLHRALERFKEQAPGVSLTDCIVMEVADHYGTKDIFGFDMQFVDTGYHRLEPSTEWKHDAES
ncbi:MAG TPA: PIN domain-containing protein [Anaerolineales bacterium]|nr:PIN domain-containing protein [Anaerolineales bacterium]